MTLSYKFNDERVNRHKSVQSLIINLRDDKLEVVTPENKTIFSILFSNNEIYFNDPREYRDQGAVLRLKDGWRCTYELIKNCDCNE